MKTSKYINNILLAIGLMLGLTAFAVGKPWDHGKLEVPNDKRMLQHTDGTGFFWMGDTAWQMTKRLNTNDITKYLTDRKNKKYTVIQTVAVVDRWGTADQLMPFEDMDHYRKPIEDYWKRVDYIIQTAEELELYVAILPMWGGKEIDKLNIDDVKVYAKWIANRYKDKKNIIWVIGGDPGDNIDKWNTMGEEINVIDNEHLITYHPSGNASSSQWFHNKNWFDFNMIQSGHSQTEYHPGNTIDTSEANSLLNIDYSKSPVKPVIDAEPRYEDIHVNLANGNPRYTAFHVREIAYIQLFSGAFGHTYGHQSIWQMWSSSLPECQTGGTCSKSWEEALNDAGGKQMQYVSELMQSRPILGRVPDQSIINSGDGVATRGNEYAFVYTSSGEPFIVNMNKTKISTEAVKASWYNPRDGKTTKDNNSPYGNTGTQEFTPPTLEDWVLILDKDTDDKPVYLDKLTSIKGSSIIIKDEEITVAVDYNSTNKDLVFSLQKAASPWTNYYNKRVSSSENGSQITFTVPNNIPSGVALMYQAYLTPKGKAWEEHVAAVGQVGVEIKDSADTVLNTWYNRNTNEKSGMVTATFTATPLDVNIDSVIGFSKSEAVKYSDLGMIVRFASTGVIDARNGSSYASSTNLVYEANKVYTFRLEINFDTKKYSIYVTPEGQGEVQIGNDYAFRTEQGALNSIDNMAHYSTIKNVVTVGEVNFSTVNAEDDTVRSITGPASITKGESVTLSVDYVASQDRTLTVYFKTTTGTKKYYFYKRITVQVGDELEEVTFTVPDDAPADATYMYGTYIAPKGEYYSDQLGEAYKYGVKMQNTGTSTIHASVVKGAAPLLVKFTDNSKTENALRWLWDLGDGTKSSLKNTERLYYKEGNYTVTLTITDKNGTEYSIGTKTIEVTAPNVSPIYVDPETNISKEEQNGTFEKPFKTWEKVADDKRYGDGYGITTGGIYLQRGGTVANEYIRILGSNEKNPVIIGSYKKNEDDKDKATLNGKDATRDNGIEIGHYSSLGLPNNEYNVSHVHVNDFNITGFRKTGVRVPAHNVGTAHHCSFTNLKIYNNAIHDKNGTSRGKFPGMYLEPTSLENTEEVNNRVTNCVSYNNGEHGFKITGIGSIVDHCEAFDNKGHGISIPIVGRKVTVVGATVHENDISGLELGGLDNNASDISSYMNKYYGIWINEYIKKEVKDARFYGNGWEIEDEEELPHALLVDCTIPHTDIYPDDPDKLLHDNNNSKVNIYINSSNSYNINTTEGCIDIRPIELSF